MQSKAFTKLFASITDSSIWSEDDATRIVWITLLAMSDAHGYVGASIPGLAARSRKTIAEVEAALVKFRSADPYSRTREYEGRRLSDADGGWVLLNYEKHRGVLVAEADKAKKRRWAAKARAEASASRLPRSTVDEVDPTPSASLSGSDLDPDPDPTREAEPIAVTSQPHVYYTLAGWEMSAALRAEAVIAGVASDDIERRLKELRNGPIGGRRGVIDRDDYVRTQFAKWRTWGETDRAKAVSGAATGPRGSFARSPQNPLGWTTTGKHEAIARRFSLDLQRLAAEYIRAGALLTRSIPDADLDFAKRLILVSRGKPFGFGVAA